MEDLLLFVEMVNILFILLWLGEIDPLVRLWNFVGLLMENMQFERARQG